MNPSNPAPAPTPTTPNPAPPAVAAPNWKESWETAKVPVVVIVMATSLFFAIMMFSSEGCRQSVRNLRLSAQERDREVAASPVIQEKMRGLARDEIRTATQPGGTLEEVRGRYHVTTSSPAVRPPLESGILVQNYWMKMRDGSEGSCYAGDSLQVVDRVGDASCIVTCVHLRNEDSSRRHEVAEGRGENATAIIPYQEYRKLVGESSIASRPTAAKPRVEFSGPREIKIPQRIEVEVKYLPPPCPGPPCGGK